MQPKKHLQNQQQNKNRIVLQLYQDQLVLTQLESLQKLLLVLSYLQREMETHCGEVDKINMKNIKINIIILIIKRRLVCTLFYVLMGSIPSLRNII